MAFQGLIATASAEPIKNAQPIIKAQLSGATCCSAAGIISTGAAPVLKLCRALVAAGHDPTEPLYVYRGDMLCLTVRSIGEGARLTVDETRTAFACWKPFPYSAVAARIAPQRPAAASLGGA